MSFSVSLDNGKTVEWSNANGLRSYFANIRQAFRLSFYRYFFDYLRFNRQAPRLLELDDDDPRKKVTVGQYLRDDRYSEAFFAYYFLPLVAAIWSAGNEDVLAYPAAQLFIFFRNHDLFMNFLRPEWKTVKDRSRQYTEVVQSILGDSAVHPSTPIAAVSLEVDGSYQLFSEAADGTWTAVGDTFDEVVFACHPPTARGILERGGIDEDQELLDLLSQINYAENVVYVHSDPSLMPKRKVAWASWNGIGKSENLPVLHTVDENEPKDAFYVTYWLNSLQNLETSQDIFVSLDPHDEPDLALTHHRLILEHPQFTFQTLQARKTIQERYQGQKGLWFCGAWENYGFHEDGCVSGFNIAVRMSGVPLPWDEQQ